MSTLRNRSDHTGLRSGQSYRQLNGQKYSIENASSYESKKTCVDVVYEKPTSGGDFDLNHWRSEGGWLTKPRLSGNTTPVFTNIRPQAYRDTSGPWAGHCSIPSRPTDSALLTTLLARSNPESTKLNVPLFAFELRELPDMIFQAGRALLVKQRLSIPSAIAGIGSANLSTSFGWNPLISDIGKLILVGKGVNERFSRWNRIADKGGTTVKRELFSGLRSEYIHVPSRLVQSLNSTIYGTDYKSGTSKCWGYARYAPKVSLPETSKARWKAAWDTYYGLKLRPADLWDALPWSWMVDYFLNVGDLIEAEQGLMHFQLTDHAIMETRSTTTRIVLSGTSISIDKPLKVFYTSKRRWSPSLSLDVNSAEPLLTKRQSGILGSLALTRIFR